MLVRQTVKDCHSLVFAFRRTYAQDSTVVVEGSGLAYDKPTRMGGRLRVREARRLASTQDVERAIATGNMRMVTLQEWIRDFTSVHSA